MDPTILTQSGCYINFVDLESNEYRIDDIAHALSNIGRFNGHTKKFYSVAQHCVLASRYAEIGFELEALMHDSTEAYIGDITSPLKKILPEYQSIEHLMYKDLSKYFGFPSVITKEVKEIDIRMLATEKRDLMPKEKTEWPFLNGFEPYEDKIRPWSPRKAKKEFLKRYKYIQKIYG